MAAEPLLEVKDLVKRFPVKRGLFGRSTQHVEAVSGVSFAIHPGETLGLVGESGCGKSTVGRLAVRLQEATAGEVRFKGTALGTLGPAQLRALRRKCQFIFQDPYGSLDPRMRIWDIVTEPLAIAGGADTAQRRARAVELLERVGLSAAAAERYPHEFSGGQRQRISIARALALDPEFIVCDEPVSALDVSIQAQVINLMKDLQRERGLSYLFISHNLAVVRHIADRVAVMYLGQLVEVAPKAALFARPRHPYTQALLAAVPAADPEIRSGLAALRNDLPSPLAPPSGCRFHTRCPLAVERCRVERPALRALGEAQVACHLAQD